MNSSRHRQWFKPTLGAPQDPPGNVATGSSAALREPGERLHGFFASLTIYELPLHVIYTGLMVMLFRAQTPCRDPLGWRGGGCAHGAEGGEAKACVNVLNIVRKRHLQLRTWRGVERGELGATLGGQKKCSRLQSMQTRLCVAEARCDYIMYKWKLTTSHEEYSVDLVYL